MVDEETKKETEKEEQEDPTKNNDDGVLEKSIEEIIKEGKNTAKEIKAENDRREAILKREEEVLKRKEVLNQLGGNSKVDLNQKREETPAEYVARIEKNNG